MVAAAALGIALAVFTEGSKLRLATRYVGIATASAAITYAIGSVVGVGTG